MATIVANKYKVIMIVNRVLDHLFTSPGIIAVLRQLDLRKVGITGREIARSAGITHRSALKALDNLEALKIVQRQIAGKSYYFTLNRTHYLYRSIIGPVFDAERELTNKIVYKIKQNLEKYSESIIIFGSVARKEETHESDFDLCIVYLKNKKIIEQKINSLRDDLYDLFGISLAPFLITLYDFKIKAKNNKPPVKNIIKEGIVICGKSINRLIIG
jgi:predicted nucleotidyltransferase